MATVVGMRGTVRRDLHDEDATSYRWTDDEIDRHVSRALREYSLARPQEKTVDVTTTPESRDLSLAALSDLIRVVAVEYRVGEYPPAYQQFRVWGATLTLLISSAPTSAETARVSYAAEHTLATLPAVHEEIVAGGAAAYAALEWANYAINRLNLDQRAAWHYLDWGRDRLGQFQGELRRLRATVRSRVVSRQ